MFTKQSVAGRVVIGMTIGFIVGIMFILLLPTVGFDLWDMIGMGALIMFVLMGAMIAFVGQFDRHPLFDFKMKWWMIGSAFGALFMLMFILLTYTEVETMMQSSLISWTGLTSPFWALIDGVIIGLIMSFAETKIAGKGAQLPLQ